MKLAMIATGVALVPTTLVIGLSFLGAAGEAAAQSSVTNTCVTTGALAGLDDAAATNARTIAAVASGTAGMRGAAIALMTALTESGLHVLGNPSVSAVVASPQGLGSDHDSVGLFQQRASWGSVTGRLDPAMSTTEFVRHLTAVNRWREEAPWVAAQQVQQSAWNGVPSAPNGQSAVVGGNYRSHWAQAEQLAEQINRDAQGASCGTLSGGLAANPDPASHGLPDQYALPADATAAESRVVLYAIAQLDKPYVFGAAGPDRFDCSGLTMAAWQQAGVLLPHSAAAQSSSGSATTAGDLVPGDLVFVPGDDGTLAYPGHVGIYIGSGLVLNASDEQVGLRVQTYSNFISVGHGLAALRHLL